MVDDKSLAVHFSLQGQGVLVLPSPHLRVSCNDKASVSVMARSVEHTDRIKLRESKPR